MWVRAGGEGWQPGQRTRGHASSRSSKGESMDYEWVSRKLLGLPKGGFMLPVV